MLEILTKMGRECQSNEALKGRMASCLVQISFFDHPKMAGRIEEKVYQKGGNLLGSMYFVELLRTLRSTIKYV